MTEIVDIITNIELVAQTAGAEKAAKTILNLTKDVEALTKERIRLGQVQASIAKDDIAQQKAVAKQIQATEKAIKDKSKAIINERVANSDLNKEIQKEIGYLGNLNQKLDALKNKQAMATTAQEVKEVNKEIRELNKELSSLTDSGSSGGGLLSGLLGGLSLAAAGAGITAFIGGSIEEFEDAEKTAGQLQRTLNVLGRGNYFEGLIDEAGELASQFHNLFDNDDIIKAQTALVNYGKLSRNEISKITPVILELATAEGIDLVQATEKMVGILEGRGGATLREYGLSVKGVKTEHDRLNLILGEFQTKLRGSADTYAETAEGIRQTNKVLVADIQERFGKAFSIIGTNFQKLLLPIFEGIANVLKSADEITEENTKGAENFYGNLLDKVNLTEKSAKLLTAEYQKQNAELKKLQETRDKLDEKITNVTGFERVFSNEQLQEDVKNLGKLDKAIEQSAGRVGALRKKLAVGSPEDDKPINRNADLTEEIEKADKKTDLAKKEEQDTEALYQSLLQLSQDYYTQNQINNEVALNEQLITEDEFKQQSIEDEIFFIDQKIEIAKQFNKSIVDLELARIKKLNQINDEDRKNQLAQLKRLDSEIEDYNKKTDTNFIKDATDGAKKAKTQREEVQKNFDAIRKNREKDVELQKQFSEATTFEERRQIKKRMELGEQEYAELQARNGLIVDSFQTVNNIIQSVGNSINQVTQISIDNIDREIEAQQGRIDRAMKYAERGGAELLEQEEERLAALEDKREKFARRQLQINAALALSNAIVAVATTAAQSGVASVATIPAVLAAIVAGYAFVNTLQEPQSFAEGTKSVDGPGTETSDSIPANLSKGERVMTAKTSKRFKPLLDDIQDGVFKDQADLINSIQSGKYSKGMNYAAVINSSTTNSTNNKDVVYALGEVKESIDNLPIPVLNADAQGLHTYYMRQQAIISKRNKY